MAFDIDEYAAGSRAVRWDDLDFDHFRDNPLPPDTLRTLRYMTDVEYHTICYTRDLLTTPSHTDDDVARFMVTWNREEFWHGEALASVLRMHDIEVGFDELRANRLKFGWRDYLDPATQSTLSRLVGKDFIAVHMSWGAANEYTAVSAYKRMAALETDPVLAELLRRIAQQESKHVAFYVSQARKRLADSRKAQIITRFLLDKVWRPVGSSIMPHEEVVYVFGQLMSGPAGAAEARRLDASISALPGLSGLQIFANSFGRLLAEGAAPVPA
ncbi:hypothetical protein [Actinoplanes sp. NBRC 103695]|uniref:hypothetical protein n=1 Tax=Actinoplanes sp. NBRC 103695 TaxID=3032202 RepID=UPI00249FD5C4|nr:hypothetical protein [Actinoplanes sp. NBRC 103695]GLY97545.1 hypothetical protein Acsp02_47990 [Actinoplanes sp. NBRC 103695]